MFLCGCCSRFVYRSEAAAPGTAHASIRGDLQVRPLKKTSKHGITGSMRHRADQGKAPTDPNFRKARKEEGTLPLVVDIAVAACSTSANRKRLSDRTGRWAGSGDIKIDS
jgi:hypothetical protein